jgi:mxaJ protein
MRAFLAVLLFATAASPAPEARRTLRVCADPNNLPFSNRAGEGLENRLAALIAADLGADVETAWWPQRRGFIRHTLKERRCDVVLGVPADLGMVLATRPYYRSSYVVVSRADRKLSVRSLDDPALRKLRIGVHLIGDDGAAAPPAHALARRGIVENVVGYSVYGDYASPDPVAEPVRAVERGEIDVAIVWGPLGGFFARRARAPLRVVPLAEEVDEGIPLRFDIAVGVRRSDRDLRDDIDAVLGRRRAEIERLLDRYGVPR